MVTLAVWIQCASVTDRQTDRGTMASSVLMQRLKINDHRPTKVFSKSI